MALQDKVKSMYDSIRDNFYLCRDDLTIGNDQFNSALLFGVLTELNKGKQLLFGEYGGGKTTSGEYLHSIFHALPIDIVIRAVIRGNPLLTQEKIMAFPDYGMMNTGDPEWKNKPVWEYFVLIEPKIVDEFNRIPESNQTMLLDGLDRGEWGYMRGHISQGSRGFFATCNYQDRGSYSLIPAVLDRFDVATESKFPGVANAISIAYNYYSEKDEALKDSETSKAILESLNSGKPYEEVRKELDKISEGFRAKLKKRGLETLTEEELDEIRRDIGEVVLDNDALTYLSFLIAELNQHPKYGQKRSNDLISGEEGAYLFNLIEGCGSRREDKTIVRYSQALAWLQNSKKASLEHILTVAPYALWHRLRLTEDAVSKLDKKSERKEPFELYAAKTLVGDGTAEMPGVKKRFLESQANYQKVANFIHDSELENAEKASKMYFARGKGHPIFLDLMQDLE